MTTVTFLGHVQRNETVVVTLAQDVHADGWVLMFKFGDIFDGHWKCETGNVEGVFKWDVVRNSLWMIWGWMNAREEGPDETVWVSSVLDVDSCLLPSQPLRGLQP